MQPLPPLLQLVLQQLLLIISAANNLDSDPFDDSYYFSKLLTMIGRGRDMVRAPLMAVKVPTNLPKPEIGKMSP